MSAKRLLRRRTTTPAHITGDSGSGQSMPYDVVRQTCRRVGAVGFVAAGLWMFALVANNLIARITGHPAMIEQIWPHPGLRVAVIGLAASLLLIYLARRLENRPQLLLDMSAVFMVLTCLLVAILHQWVPPPVSPRVSWLCILILAYPAIVPSTPGRTVVVALLAASMDPLALLIADLRGAPFEHKAFYYVWNFSPTYLSALIAVIPAKIIRGLSHQVRRARELGSYRLEEVLGKGGMGEVYRASHQMLARPAAVKIIRSEMLGSSSPDKARVIIERFRREAEAAAALRSPHTINLYDFGAAQDGTFFLVMELLEGLDLESLVQRFGPLPPERAAYLLGQACESLGEAHARGLIHRDIKPANIFTCRVGLAVDFVKVLDFGLVKARDDGQSSMLTAPDATAGTPAYMAPEVIRGDAVVDHRVDIYALGCVGYWLVTGQLVFEAPNALQLMFQHAQNTPVPPSQRTETAISPALDQLLLACLAKRPEDRPATAGELAKRLEAVTNGEVWTQDRALHWWDRHRPESARQAPTDCGGMTLTKVLGTDPQSEAATR